MEIKCHEYSSYNGLAKDMTDPNNKADFICSPKAYQVAINMMIHTYSLSEQVVNPICCAKFKYESD